MKHILLCVLLATASIATRAAEAKEEAKASTSPKEEVAAAAKKLAEKSSYSWVTLMELPGMQFTPGPMKGKTEKDGYTWLSQEFGDNTTEAIVKGTNGVAKTEDGWQTVAELTADGGNGGFNPKRMAARLITNPRIPASDLTNMLAKVKELKKDGDAFSGEFTEAGAKELAGSGFGRPGGPGPSKASGSMKVWVKDGVVSKIESKLASTMKFQDEDRDIQRNTTTEIKDVGTAKVEVPEGAKKKLTP